MMKDYIVYQMMGQFGVSSPLCSYVYLTVNGEDWGLYLAVEGVEESFLERNYGSNYGELYKPDSQDMGGGRGNGRDFIPDNESLGFDRPAFSGAEQEPFGMPGGQRPGGPEMPDMGEMPDMAQHPDTSEMPGVGQATDMERPFDAGPGDMGSSDVSLLYTDDDPNSYSNIFDNAKTDSNAGDQARLIAALKNLGEGSNIENTVDVDAVIRYFVVHNFVLNFDSYTGTMMHNYYLYEKEGRLSMIPWDYNLSFGAFQSSAGTESLVNYPIDTPVSGGSIQNRPMLAWIFENQEYTELYHEYFHRFIETFFESGRFEQEIARVYNLISPYVEKDPTKFCSFEQFSNGVEMLQSFCRLRAESIAAQLDGSIPSTAGAQKSDNSALISADGIDISAMGSMGHDGPDSKAPEKFPS